jgi:hypothetical protein
MTGQDPQPGPVPRAGRTPWQHYVDLIRALDAERTAEEARTSTYRQNAEAAALEVERLAPLLIDQGAELSHLARRLRVAQPRLSAEPVTSQAGPYELVVQATRLTARAGSYAREAHSLATRARFLPDAPAGFRNFVIYLMWALAGLGVQYGMVLAGQGTPDRAVSGQGTSTVGVLIVVPLVAYVGGLVSIGVLARPPLAVRRPGLSARMGALVCFGIFPFGLVVLGLSSLFG